MVTEDERQELFQFKADLEQKLRNLTDKGLVFSDLWPSKYFEGLVIFAANYHGQYHVAAMDIFDRYPRFLGLDNICLEFVYYTFIVKKSLFYVIKVIDCPHLVIIPAMCMDLPKEPGFNASQQKLYHITLNNLAVLKESFLQERADFHGSLKFAQLTMRIETKALGIVYGSYDGGVNAQKKFETFIKCISVPDDLSPQLKNIFDAGVKSITQALSTPYAITHENWVDCVRRNLFWNPHSTF